MSLHPALSFSSFRCVIPRCIPGASCRYRVLATSVVPGTAVRPPSADRGEAPAGARRRSDGRLVLLLRADAVHVLDRDDEDLPVTDVTRAGGVEDRAHRNL